MKKIMILAAATAMLSLASCQKVEPFDNIGDSVRQSPVFTATINAGDTKTSVNLSNGKVAWEANDEITITDAASTSAIYEIESIDDEGKATFVIKEGQPVLGAGPYTAVYSTEPSTLQTYRSTAGRLYMTAPETTTNSFTFDVKCGILKLVLTQDREDIAEIHVSGTPTGGSKTRYRLICKPEQNISNAKDFYIALPAGNYTELVFVDSKGKECTKTVKGTPLAIAVNHIKPVTFSSLSFSPILFKLNGEVEEDLDENPDVSGIQW